MCPPIVHSDAVAALQASMINLFHNLKLSLSVSDAEDNDVWIVIGEGRE